MVNIFFKLKFIELNFGLSDVLIYHKNFSKRVYSMR
jgi:hypothetical protein